MFSSRVSAKCGAFGVSLDSLHLQDLVGNIPSFDRKNISKDYFCTETLKKGTEGTVFCNSDGTMRKYYLKLP